MTVADLIEFLKTLPKNAVIEIEDTKLGEMRTDIDVLFIPGGENGPRVSFTVE